MQSKDVKIVNTTTYVPVDTPSQTITYLELGSNFDQGNLTIAAGNTTFSTILPAVQYGR